jgi:hypothetical protein
MIDQVLCRHYNSFVRQQSWEHQTPDRTSVAVVVELTCWLRKTDSVPGTWRNELVDKLSWKENEDETRNGRIFEAVESHWHIIRLASNQHAACVARRALVVLSCDFVDGDVSGPGVVNLSTTQAVSRCVSLTPAPPCCQELFSGPVNSAIPSCPGSRNNNHAFIPMKKLLGLERRDRAPKPQVASHIRTPKLPVADLLVQILLEVTHVVALLLL